MCPEVFIQEAKDLNLSLDQHYAHLIIHGVLHLLGLDHEAEEEAAFMEEQEVLWLQKIGYNHPYS
jgi:probable rRNA maturation factor